MLHFIINPSSSSGAGLRIWEQVEDLLQENNAAYVCHFLEKQGDAALIAAKLSEEISRETAPRTIAVVGGDGTINEVLSGFTTFEGFQLAYIPTGSGNDFARSMQLPSSPSACVDMILHSQETRDINVGIARYGGGRHCFAISSGMGFDAEVCHISLSSGLKRFLNALHIGKLVYLFGALRLLYSIQPHDIDVYIDEAQTIHYQDAWFATAMNMKYEGGGFMFCPNAQPDDDELDFITVCGISKRQILRYLPKALSGRHVSMPGVHILRCRTLRIRADKPLCTHADGEHLGYIPEVTYSLSKQKIKLII